MSQRSLTRIHQVLAIALVSVLGLVVACQTQPAATPVPPTAAPAAKQPAITAPAATAVPREDLADAIVMAVGSMVANLDPQFATGQTAGIFARMSFDSLTIPDREGKIAPWLARSWRAIDPTTWEFTLREGVFFADGTPYNASVARANLDRMTGPGASGAGSAQEFLTVAGSDVVSPTVLRIRTRSADPIIPNRMSLLYAVPTSYPEKVGDPPVNLRTTGTGPYQSKEFRPGQSYELTINPSSWRVRENGSSLQTVRLQATPEPATMIAALRTREVDMAFGPPFNQVAALRSDGLEITSALAASISELRMNIVDEPADSPLRKKEVRQALNYALDKDALRQVAYAGFGRVAEGQLLGSNTFGYNPALRPYPFDPARARQLLAQAGYPNGFTTRILTVPTGALFAFAEPIQGMFSNVGVRAEIVRVDLPTLVQRNAAGNLEPLNILGADAFPIFDADRVLRMYSNVIPEANRLWGNDQFSELYVQSTREVDRTRREQIIHQALALMREEAPTVFLVQQEWVFALSPKVRGFVARPDAVVMFDEMRKLK